MPITFGSLTALALTRAIRCGAIEGDLAQRCDMAPPSPAPQRRWSSGQLSRQLSSIGVSAALLGRRSLDVVVPDKGRRVQARGVGNTVMSGSLPADSFIDLGNGIAMSCPELMFIELGNVVDPVIHLLIGMELCGSFSRSAASPRNGRIAYGIAPATSAAKLRAFAGMAHGVRGAARAHATIDLIAENAWSPMEAIVAALAMLPFDRLGLGFGPIHLNPRKELGERLSRLSEVGSRVPDIMFTGTDVGLNYDGEDHFRLDEITRAAVAFDRDPGNADREKELRDALREARSRIVADKRRDRDLMSLGLTVFSITKEDLLEPGGFERVMGQVVEAIERTEGRSLAAQRLALGNERLSRARLDLIRSLTPGVFAGGVGISMADLGMGLDEAVVRVAMGENGPVIVSQVRDRSPRQCGRPTGRQ